MFMSGLRSKFPQRLKVGIYLSSSSKSLAFVYYLLVPLNIWLVVFCRHIHDCSWYFSLMFFLSEVEPFWCLYCGVIVLVYSSISRHPVVVYLFCYC